MNFLGLDFGTKSIGYAIGQEITQTANPTGRILRKNNVPDWVDLGKVIKTWNVKTIIIGYPLNMDGSDQEISTMVMHFAKELKTRFELDIYLVDERLTTVEAKNFIFERYSAKKLKKELIDAISAAIILQNYLDTKEYYLKL